MANKSAARKAKQEAARKRKRRGRTSTASQGLVLHVIKNDPECEWFSAFVQQFGEKVFGVDSYTRLDSKQRAEWLRFNNAMAVIGRRIGQREGDLLSLVRFLERLGAAGESTDLAEVEAEMEALAGTDQAAGEPGPGEAPSGGSEQRAGELHVADLEDRKAWRRNQRTLIWLIAFSVFFTAVMTAFGAVGEKAVFLGGGGIGAGMAVGLIKAVFSGDMNPFSVPWRSSDSGER